MELRCDNKLHGIVRDDGLLEIKCSSAFCGSKPGVVVLHLFDMASGELVRTNKFKDTPKVNNKRNRRVA